MTFVHIVTNLLMAQTWLDFMRQNIKMSTTRKKYQKK